MQALKSFVQEAVCALENSQLEALAGTLRIDLRSCEDREDIERILAGLICLDKDTSLGVFLSWLHSNQQNAAITQKKPFHNTFLPLISPCHRSHKHKNQEKPSPEDQVKEHHLDEEITQRLDELTVLEQDFKNAERLVHTGTPSFEKMKQFLVKLTILRAKEEETRRFFIKQSQLLRDQHTSMKQETLHTREQLAFFVDGFTNLRHRHDVLLEKSTQMKAENEVCQELFLSMSANESHFAAVMKQTLDKQVQCNKRLQQQLDQAEEETRQLKQKQQELEVQISHLKQERGDAWKDAHLAKRQMRRCKQQLGALKRECGDAGMFQQEAQKLRQSFATLFGFLRDSVLRDTKSAKQVLSKEITRLIHQVVHLSTATSTKSSPVSLSQTETTPFITADTPESSYSSSPRVIQREVEAKKDLDEVMRGIILLGGRESDDEACAQLMSKTLRYLPVDVKETLENLKAEQHQVINGQTSPDSVNTLEAVPDASLDASVPSTLPVEIESYATQFQQHVRELMTSRGACGFVLYNWAFSSHHINVLIRVGLSIDSIIDLTLPPPPPVAGASTTPLKTPITSSSKPTTAAKAVLSASSYSTSKPTTPNSSKTVTPSSLNSPVKAAGSGAVPTSPSRSSSRQPPKTPTDSKRQSTPVAPAKSIQKSNRPPSSTPVTSTPSATNSPQKSSQPAPTKVVDRKVAFPGMLHLFQRVPPTPFIEERVAAILQVLEIQKQKKLAPFVQWDEATQRTNESLSMMAEEILMMLWVEQENRKPKPPQESSNSSSSTTTTSASNVKKATDPGRGASPTRVTPSSPSHRTSKSPPKLSPMKGTTTGATQATRRTSVMNPVARGNAVVSPTRSTASSVSPKRPITASSSGKSPTRRESKVVAAVRPNRRTTLIAQVKGAPTSPERATAPSRDKSL